MHISFIKKKNKKKKTPWSCFYYLLDIVNKMCWHASQHRPEFLKCPVFVHKSSHALFFIHYRGCVISMLLFVLKLSPYFSKFLSFKNNPLV